MNKTMGNNQTLPAGHKAEFFIGGHFAAGHGENCNAGGAAICRNLPVFDPRRAHSQIKRASITMATLQYPC